MKPDEIKRLLRYLDAHAAYIGVWAGVTAFGWLITGCALDTATSLPGSVWAPLSLWGAVAMPAVLYVNRGIAALRTLAPKKRKRAQRTLDTIARLEAENARLDAIIASGKGPVSEV